MDQARRIAPLLMADIAAGILAGAVFFCVGDDDGRGSWDAFELEGEQAFAQLLGQDFGGAAVAGAAPAAPKAATLWQEWYDTDGNEHVKEPPALQGAAFLAHATAVTKATVNIARALALGMPQAVADALEKAPRGQNGPGYIELTAAKLGAAAQRIEAVKAVESAGTWPSARRAGRWCGRRYTSGCRRRRRSAASGRTASFAFRMVLSR